MKRPEEREYSLEALRHKTTEIIIALVRAEWGIPEPPIAAEQIPGFFGSVRQIPAFARPWIRPVKLPDAISIQGLFQLTEPKPRPDPMTWDHKAKWLAILLLSLYPDEHDPAHRVYEAERALTPPPPPLFTLDESGRPVDETGRPLKASEIRLKKWASDMAPKGRNAF
jgi:hypothetical protein